MAAINVDQLVGDIKNAATTIINKDIATVKGFSDRQTLAIAQHAAMVSEGIATGQITEATREFFLDSIETMTQNFLDVLGGLLVVTIEKLWNAIVAVLWKAINGAISATGLMLPVPTKA